MSVIHPPRSIAPGSRFGRYEILARLAAGGMATVYAARCLGAAGFERLVAVKVLHEYLAHERQFIAMFFDEARLAARIRHPNVVGTLDVSELHGLYFLVMEYIEGDNFGQLLQLARQRGERVPPPIVLRVMTDSLAGLAAAHNLCDERGRWLQLVHRDMSPHNIMVGWDGVARITDFGVAKANDRLTYTQAGQIKGKLPYMAPEQASSGHADPRSDVFSLGVLLWEALTGRRLFEADNCAVILNRLLQAPVPLPSAIDAALAPFDGVVARALHRDPEVRFGSAEEFAAALEALAARVCGGLSTRQQVGGLVAHLAHAKLARLRRAIAAVIHGEPPPDDGGWVNHAGTVSHSFSLPGDAEEDGVTHPGGPAARRRRLGPPAGARVWSSSPDDPDEPEAVGHGRDAGWSGVRAPGVPDAAFLPLDGVVIVDGGRMSLLLRGGVLVSGIAAFFIMLWAHSVPDDPVRAVSIDVITSSPRAEVADRRDRPGVRGVAGPTATSIPRPQPTAVTARSAKVAVSSENEPIHHTDRPFDRAGLDESTADPRCGGVQLAADPW